MTFCFTVEQWKHVVPGAWLQFIFDIFEKNKLDSGWVLEGLIYLLCLCDRVGVGDWVLASSCHF